METKKKNRRPGACAWAGIIIPLPAGLLTGFVWVRWGSEVDDVPLLSLSLLGLCVGLFYLGVRNLNRLNRWLKPGIVLPLLFGSLIVTGGVAYLLGGVYSEPPGVVAGGLLMGFTLLAVGIFNLRRLLRALH